MPWWAVGAISYLLVGPTYVDQGLERRLEESDAEPSSQGVAPLSLKDGKMTVRVPCYLMVKPCGDVLIPSDGLNFTFPFGRWEAMGSKSATAAVRQTEHAFSQYTLYAATLLGGYFILQDLRDLWKQRQKAIASAAAPAGVARAPSREDLRLKYGMVEISDDEEEDDLKTARQVRMDIGAADFLGHGNIFRVLAVLHPIPLPRGDTKRMPKGHLTLMKWIGFAMEAAVCAFMQVNLPLQILTDTLSKWELNGVKSPLWFIANLAFFATTFATLASICNIFRGRVEGYICRGAEANYYILTHRAAATSEERQVVRLLGEKEPERKEFTASDMAEMEPMLAKTDAESAMPSSPLIPQLSLLSQAWQAAKYFLSWQFSCTCCGKVGYSAMGDAAVAAELNELLSSSRDVISIILRVNEVFWCSLSQLMSVVISLLLLACMFVKVATYTGDIGNIALVAVSLYFIFDLEERLFEAHPKLRTSYRAALKQQVILRQPRLPARAMLQAAIGSLWLCRFVAPFGIYGIAAVAWKNTKTGFVIGGSGLE